MRRDFKFSKMFLHLSSLVLVLCSIFVAPLSLADEDDEPSTPVYVKLSKGMVINYGEPSLSRLKYLKIAIQVRLGSIPDGQTIEHHMPALKDALITLLSACDEELILSTGGREEIRLMALAAVQKVIKKEEGEPLIQDLLFGSFIVQR